MEAIGIFGSLARGEERKHADIDIFVIIAGDKWHEDIEKEWYFKMHRVLKKYWRDITVTVHTVKALKNICSWYIFELASDSIIVYDKGQVKPLFERIVNKAIESGLVRKRYGRHTVWAMGRNLEPGEVFEIKPED